MTDKKMGQWPWAVFHIGGRVSCGFGTIVIQFLRCVLSRTLWPRLGKIHLPAQPGHFFYFPKGVDMGG